MSYLNNKEKQRDFISYVYRSDEASAVLKCCLQLELDVNEQLKTFLPHPQTILNRYFSDKVEVLYSVGALSEKVANSLKRMNQIRNKFAHEYNYKLSKEDLSFLESVSPAVETETKEELKNRILLLVVVTTYLSAHMAESAEIFKKEGVSSYKEIVKALDRK